MRKWLVGGIVLVVVGLLVVVSLQTPKKLKITTIRESHHVINEEEQGGILEIDLFMNQRQAPLTKKENITRVSLQDQENIIPMDLQAITLKSRVQILEEEYEEWSYQFKITFPQECAINPALLVFDTIFLQEIVIDIGAVSYYNQSALTTDPLHLTQLKALVAYDGASYLSGIIMRVLPHQVPMSLVMIEPLDCELVAGTPIEISSDEVVATTPIEELVTISYHRMNDDVTVSPVLINQEVTLLIPLYYHEPYHISELAFRIHVCIEDQMMVYYVPTFCFFKDSIKKVSVSELIFYEFSID